MKKIIMACLLLCVLCLNTFAGQVSKIELTDGSVIKGEVLSFVKGIYTINTSTFGEIKINASRVSKIESAQTSSIDKPLIVAPQSDTISPSQLDSYKKSIMNNPDNMAVITELAADPQMQDLAKDPDIIKAAQAGDMQALMKNKKFIDLLSNPKMQDSIKKIKQ